MPNIRFLDSRITAKKLPLDLSKRRTCLDKINRLNARRKRFEIPQRLI